MSEGEGESNSYACFCALFTIASYISSPWWMVLLGGSIQGSIFQDKIVSASCLALTEQSEQKIYFDTAMMRSLLLLAGVSFFAGCVNCCGNENGSKFNNILVLFYTLWPFLVISLGQDSPYDNRKINTELYSCQIIGLAGLLGIVFIIFISTALLVVLSKCEATIYKAATGCGKLSVRLFNTLGYLLCCQLTGNNVMPEERIATESTEHVVINILQTVGIDLSLESMNEFEMAKEKVSFIQRENNICVITQALLANCEKIIQIDSCKHTFDALALLKWLKENACCPLCKVKVKDCNALTLFKLPQDNSTDDSVKISLDTV